MQSIDYVENLQLGGFNYENCIRNHAIASNLKAGKQQFKQASTGTTICGVIFKVRICINQKRMEFAWLLTRELLADPLWEIRTARRSTT
jgi:hypothetical protein